MTESLNIRQFKLTNGEEIVALVHDKNSEVITIERPCRVQTSMLGGFQLLPWFAFSSQKIFTLPRQHIIYHVEIDNEVKDAYIKAATLESTPVKPISLTEEEMLAEYEDIMEETITDRLSKKIVH
jgi:hypothetical protein